MKKLREGYKRLEGVKPFNDFHFVSCYYQQLISAYGYFGVDKNLFIEKYLPLYKYDEEKQNFGIGEIMYLAGTETERDTGVRLIKRRAAKDIIGKLIRAIDRGRLCLVAVDCYSLSYREDTYRKKHAPHFLLVYGYDTTGREFIVNEHMYFNSPRYYERRISFRDLMDGYTSFDLLLREKKGFGMLELVKRGEPAEAFLKSGFEKFYRSCQSEIAASAKACVKILQRIEDDAAGGAKQAERLNAHLEYLGKVRTKKSIQKYQLQNISEDRYAELTDRILEDYIFIYGILVRIIRTNAPPGAFAEKLKARCEEIGRAERILHDYYLGRNNE